MDLKLNQHSRSELIYMARLFERAEKFPEMAICIEHFIKMNPKLNHEERNILSAGFKNLISNKRFSWRYLQNMINKEEKESNIVASSYIKEIKKRVEDEIKKICKDINILLDSFLIPNSDDDNEFKVFYLKMKGDYFRYLCEFLKDEELNAVTTNAEKTYKEAYELAEKTLPISSTTRLGTALNYSVLMFEIMNNKDEACVIAKQALDEGLKILDELEKNKQKDTILIIQLLMENLMLWNAEEKDE